ncbi:hypothetical protein D3C73_1338050 [compost metagenome]
MNFINDSILPVLIAFDVRCMGVRRIGLAQINDRCFAHRISVRAGCACSINGEYCHRFGIRIKHLLHDPVIRHFILVIVAAHILLTAYSCDVG